MYLFKICRAQEPKIAQILMLHQMLLSHSQECAILQDFSALSVVNTEILRHT